LLTLAALTAVSLLGTPRRADASLVLALQEAGTNGGAVTIVDSQADFTGVTYNTTYGAAFRITLFGGSSDNDAAVSDLLSAVTSIRNISASTQTIKIFLGQNNYTLPSSTPLSVESGMGGSVNNGNLGLTGIFQAFANNNNQALDITAFTNGPQNGSQTGSTFDTGSAVGLFNRTSAVSQFALVSVATITLSAGASINYSSHVNVTTAVPEPGSVVSAAVGLSCIGGVSVMRRRKRTA